MKKEQPKKRARLHPRSKHHGRYHFKQLIRSCPDLAAFVLINKYGDESINFHDPEAVKMLNKALLAHHYGIKHWDIPNNYLCPPIPGRADYLHHLVDWLASHNNDEIPTGESVKCLDIGVGANCIYPMIGHKEYGWTFIGSDIDPVAIEAANKTVAANPSLVGKVELRLQTNSKKIFEGIVKNDETIDVVICNPPFHASLAEARAATVRKVSNLKGKSVRKASRNFGGKNNEIWCAGGEEGFVRAMAIESKRYSKNCKWFSSLISKQATLAPTYDILRKLGAKDVKAIPMGQGNKFSRIIVWRF